MQPIQRHQAILCVDRFRLLSHLELVPDLSRQASTSNSEASWPQVVRAFLLSARSADTCPIFSASFRPLFSETHFPIFGALPISHPSSTFRSPPSAFSLATGWPSFVVFRIACSLVLYRVSHRIPSRLPREHPASIIAITTNFQQRSAHASTLRPTQPPASRSLPAAASHCNTNRRSPRHRNPAPQAHIGPARFFPLDIWMSASHLAERFRPTPMRKSRLVASSTVPGILPCFARPATFPPPCLFHSLFAHRLPVSLCPSVICGYHSKSRLILRLTVMSQSISILPPKPSLKMCEACVPVRQKCESGPSVYALSSGERQRSNSLRN